jgi:hypothetical protein
LRTVVMLTILSNFGCSLLPPSAFPCLSTLVIFRLTQPYWFKSKVYSSFSVWLE